VLTAFKITGFILSNKVELHFKYKAGVQLMLWERMNHRLGLCLGLFNGAAYLVLLSMAIYLLSYWTYQMATPNNDPFVVRVVNRLGGDLEKSGMSTVARSIDRAPTAYYDAADVVGLIYHNPLLEARLSRYPAFLGLGERPEFQDLATDAQFTEAWQSQKSIASIINYPKVQNILKNPQTLKAVHDAVLPNLQDLHTFLTNGTSKFDSEAILGRWDFHLNNILAEMRKSRPTLSRNIEARRLMSAGFGRTVLVATPEGQAIVKNLPRFRAGAAAPEVQTVAGEWKNQDGKYEMIFNMDGRTINCAVTVQGNRLAINGPGMELGFVREE
jgi:hypothetical protein